MVIGLAIVVVVVVALRVATAIGRRIIARDIARVPGLAVHYRHVRPRDRWSW